MTHILTPHRPARAAIAAVLALSATPLIAQDIPAPEAMQPAPVQQAAPVMPQAMPVQPSTPPVTSQAQTTQPNIATPTTSALPGEPMPMASPVAPAQALTPPVAIPSTPVPNIAQPETVAPRAQNSERASTPARQVRTTPTAPNAAPVEPAPVMAESEPPAMSAEETMASMPMAPLATSAGQAEQVTPPAADRDTSGQGNGEVWGWLAALLAALGLGGGAIALSRSRTRGAATSAKPVAPAESGNETMVPVAQASSGLAGPHDRQITDPAAQPVTTRVEQPPMQQQTGMTPLRSRPVVNAPKVSRDSNDGIDRRQLEQMIAQRPSRENPFVTRANRKRRAVFLLQNRYPMQSAA